MNRINELDLAVSHYATARPALDRNQARAMAGDLEGVELAEHQCPKPCPRCIRHCAVLGFLVQRLEEDIAQHGGMVVDGQAFAFFGRA